MKLTPKQNEVIFLLQNGYVLVTGPDCGAILTMGYDNRVLRLDLFFNLVKKKLIYQESAFFHYVLTDFGKSTKTTPVPIPDLAYKK